MYLLLRNNKQSGPYSLEDLKSMGMKAYDLVWLEGKSAAWRYPSELDELKEFAPAVEEQPFDRFYKRTGAATNGGGANKETTTTTTTVAFQPATETFIPGESTVLTRKRIIYVTLPAGKPGVAPSREAPRETQTREIPREAPIKAPIIGNYPSLPDRKETTAVEIMPRRRSHKNERLFQILGVGGCILALLAAGIFIGLSLNKDTLGQQKRIASRSIPPVIATQSASSVPTSGSPVVNAAVPSGPNEKTADAAKKSIVTSAVDNKSSATDGLSPINEKTTKARKKERSKTIPPAMPPVQKDSAIADIPIVTREAVHRAATGPADSKETVRTELASEVSVGTNGYSVGTFGGINDLQLTVTNRSTYPLDLVVVEVQYIQANKKIYKTENLYFHDIGPGAALMQEAPRTSRGIRVQYKITAISSKELGLSYSGL